MTMTPPTTRIPPRPGAGPVRPQTNGMRVSPTKPRRNAPLVAVGVLLVVGFGLAAAVLQVRAAHRTAAAS